MSIDIGHRAIVDATLTDGGGTFDALTLQPFRPTDGYAVAIDGITRKAADLAPYRIPILARHVAGEFGATFVGTWIDEGTVYIDAVAYVRDRAEALAMGRAANQIAVWDFAAGEAVSCG